MGLFPYIEGYRFKVKGSTTFSIEPGELVTLEIVLFEKDGFVARFEDRPSLRYEVKTERLVP